jgi:hypothetical protein
MVVSAIKLNLFDHIALKNRRIQFLFFENRKASEVRKKNNPGFRAQGYFFNVVTADIT